MGLRLHHISNAGLDDDNRGVNSIVFVLGRFF
jgi:lipid A 3-O-deacylase